MAESSSSPLFAGRYRFHPVNNDWDRGRSGYTHLVFDIEKERMGVIKRAEIKSQQAVEGLRNEVKALLDLKGLGVPGVYDTGEANYGSTNYFYVVIEYIEGIRVEKNIETLSAVERAEILTQFFGLLASAHNIGIVNGDVDLKHLFWRKDEKQLVVIDWGNAKLEVDPKKKTEFAYDLARSAEIIYSLVTRSGHPPTRGSIVLPDDDSKLVPGLTPLPDEFRDLCIWAPRAPLAGIQSPISAQELLEASKDWKKQVWGKQVQSAKSHKPIERPKWELWLLFGVIIIAVAFLSLSPKSPLYPIIYPNTSTVTLPSTSSTTITATETTIPTVSPTATSIESPTGTATFIPSPAITPSPRTYTDMTPALTFDEHLTTDKCWINKAISSSELKSPNDDGFTRRKDNNWRFSTSKNYRAEDIVQAELTPCIQGKQINAVALNVWVTNLELERDSPDNPGVVESGKEFGFFIEDLNGQRREYTISIGKDKLLHLRIRENNAIKYDEARAVLNNLKVTGVFPRRFAEFSIQIFFEIDNQDLDIIYLQGGSLTQAPGTIHDIIPSEAIRVDSAVLPTLGKVRKIGLIGYGGDIRTLIWPLVFFGE